MNEIQNPMVDLVKAKELCKQFSRVLNSHVILMNSVAPMVTSNGVLLSKDAQAAAQRELNKKGMLVVISDDGETPENVTKLQDNKVYEGEKILFNPNSMVAFTTTITTEELLDGLTLPDSIPVREEMYKKYVILCMHKSNIACTIK